MRPVMSLLNNAHSLTPTHTHTHAHVHTTHACTPCHGICPSQPTITLISRCLLKIHGPRCWRAAGERLATILNRTVTNKSRFHGDWNGFLQSLTELPAFTEGLSCSHCLSKLEQVPSIGIENIINDTGWKSVVKPLILFVSTILQCESKCYTTTCHQRNSRHMLEHWSDLRPFLTQHSSAVVLYNMGSDRARVANTTAMMTNVVHYNCLDRCVHAVLQLQLVEHRAEGGKRKPI